MLPERDVGGLAYSLPHGCIIARPQDMACQGRDLQ